MTTFNSTLSVHKGSIDDFRNRYSIEVMNIIANEPFTVVFFDGISLPTGFMLKKNSYLMLRTPTASISVNLTWHHIKNTTHITLVNKKLGGSKIYKSEGGAFERVFFNRVIEFVETCLGMSIAQFTYDTFDFIDVTG